MANPVLCKSPCSDWLFLGQAFALRTVSMETVQPVCFCFGPSYEMCMAKFQITLPFLAYKYWLNIFSKSKDNEEVI